MVLGVWRCVNGGDSFFVAVMVAIIVTPPVEILVVEVVHC